MSKVETGRNHLLKDPKLAPYIMQIPLDDFIPSFDAYEGLLSSIVSQQLSVKAADTIYGRFLDLFPDRYPTASLLVQKSIEEIKGAGLSRQKAQYVNNVATYFEEMNLFDHDWSRQSDTEIIKMLTAIKGVGRWTVEMILMFTLDRRDILPVGDLGIQQAMTEIYNLSGGKKELAAQMEAAALQWSPHRTLACRYLWKYKNAPSLDVK